MGYRCLVYEGNVVKSKVLTGYSQSGNLNDRTNGVFVLNGSDAERYAETFLRHHNLVLLERNFRCRSGEIDLIMRDGTTLVFVEVRMRSSAAFGGAAASITWVKQKKLLRAARHYLASLKSEPPCRFDAILLSGRDGKEVEWIKNAFGE